MPNYRWSCLACGAANAAEALSCGSCGCPAGATARDIAERRDQFVRQGGVLTGDARSAGQGDLSAIDVLVRPVLAILAGWWPRRR